MTVLRTPTAQPGEALIELHHVARRFTKRTDRSRSLQELFIRFFRKRTVDPDEFWPLRDVSLIVRPGDCVGVIGPNGSGKSTLLKLITGILPPTRGDIIVRGRVSSLLELGAGFHPDLTGRENIYLNGSIYGLDRAAMDRRLDEIIAYAGLGDFIDTPVKHYSSGMFVRLGFAVAIHTDPDLLLVDEVLAVGDAAFQHRCMESIYRLRREGKTLLLVSHDLRTVESLCSRAVWIQDGLIAAEGAPGDVIMAYNRYVAAQEEAEAAQRRPPVESTRVGVGARHGSRSIEITHVELCDADGTPSSSFVTGETLIVRLYYRRHRPVEPPVFGMAIHHENGFHLFGPNTLFAGVDTELDADEGSIDYVIPRLTLLEGHYAVSVAVHNRADTETYDYHDRAYPLRVVYSPARAGYGMVDLQGSWQPPVPAGRAAVRQAGKGPVAKPPSESRAHESSPHPAHHQP